MSTPEFCRIRSLFLILLVLFLAVTSPAVAQDGDDLADLIEALEVHYRVLPSSDGYVLTPRQEDSGVNLVEIESGQVAVDGEILTLEELQRVLGEDTGKILQLSERFVAAEGERDGEEMERRLTRLQELEEARNRQLEELREIEDSLEEVRGSEPDEAPSSRRDRHRRDTRMAFGNSLIIAENESARDVVVLGGKLEILGEVRGDAVVVGGDAEVSGEVRGDLTVVGGSVLLEPGAKINGEVVSIGGPVVSDPESFVRGGITELDLGPTFDLEDINWAPGDWFRFLWPGSWFRFGWSDTIDRISHALFLALIMVCMVLIARRPVERVARRADREPWKSALVGLLVQILIGPVVFLLFVLLMVSVVGIPLAVMLLPVSVIALVVFLLLGYAGVAMVAGGWLQKRFDLQNLNPYLLVLLGVVLIQGWSILGEALSFGGGPIHFTAVLLLFFGFLLKYCVWTTGLGAVTLHSFSPDPVTEFPALSPPPPPPLPPSEGENSADDEDSWSAGEVDEHGEWEEAARAAEEAGAESEADDAEKGKAAKSGETPQ